ncbi:hypothetical protein M427DRAFT_489669 [Gonapodya prolifera JEL478]|uniref:Uncharacterized protein n=1 Tax=Gonapodya prolifera (strain JEL478) TaxID=1344416 RepID=A0A138ZYZ7_GONPJ|nr:hypothetical protein M427DRAFT_489669 [Gonapodya prolifera JEL478]|eukprot:KXS09720.1 hypothetical protein M427DRAFT_489669 [Gonapodya prolifera JEL478]
MYGQVRVGNPPSRGRDNVLGANALPTPSRDGSGAIWQSKASSGGSRISAGGCQVLSNGGGCQYLCPDSGTPCDKFASSEVLNDIPPPSLFDGIHSLRISEPADAPLTPLHSNDDEVIFFSSDNEVIAVSSDEEEEDGDDNAKPTVYLLLCAFARTATPTSPISHNSLAKLFEHWDSDWGRNYHVSVQPLSRFEQDIHEKEQLVTGVVVKRRMSGSGSTALQLGKGGGTSSVEQTLSGRYFAVELETDGVRRVWVRKMDSESKVVIGVKCGCVV